MKRITFTLCLLFSTTALIHTDVCAQSTAGSIQGTVKDRTGDPIPGASVTAHDAATNITQTAVTGEDGVFVVPQLPPGNYTITVEKAGFKKFSRIIVSNNVRGQRVADANRPLGDFFGEYNRARNARVIQLGVKLSF